MTQEKEELQSQLQDKDHIRRWQAALKLCELYPYERVEAADLPPILAVLLEMLDAPDSDWRSGLPSNAAFKIGRIGKAAQAAIPKLIEQLQKRDISDLGNVCYALSEMGELAAGAVVPLTELLRNPRHRNYNLILLALGNIGDPASNAVLDIIEQLNDPNSMVRTSAAMALGGIGRSSVIALPKLIETLNDPNATTRMSAAVGLRGMQELAYESVPALIRALQDPDIGVRVAVILTLVAIDEDAKLGFVEVTELINRANSSEFEALSFWLHPLENAAPSWAYALLTQT